MSKEKFSFSSSQETKKDFQKNLAEKLKRLSKKTLVLILLYSSIGVFDKALQSNVKIEPPEKPKNKKGLTEKNQAVTFEDSLTASPTKPVDSRIEQVQAILPDLTKKALEDKIIETMPNDQQVIDFCYSFYDQGKDHADYLVDKVPTPKSIFTLTTQSFRADNQETTSRQILGELPAPNQTIRLISNTLSNLGALSVGSDVNTRNRFMDIVVFSEDTGGREVMPGEKYTATGHGETEKQAIADALREAVIHQKVIATGLNESGGSNKQSGTYINCHGFRRIATNKADGLITGYQIVSTKKKNGLYEAVVIVTLGEYKK